MAILEDALEEYGDLQICVHNQAGDMDRARTVEPTEHQEAKGFRDVLLILP
jgi:hypothetical protein